MRTQIVIVGSLNMDFVVQTARLPLSGETISGWDFQTLPGGKGANQASAVGRLGGNGIMIGCVGEDIFGNQLIESLRNSNVDTKSICIQSGEPTGIAQITVEEGGQNQIVIAPGANGSLTPEKIMPAMQNRNGGYLLMQLESPIEAVATAAKIGHANGMTTILDPAPAQPLHKSLLENIDILTPNETEALFLLDRQGETISLDNASEIGRQLLTLGPGKVIIKLGSQGAWLETEFGGQHFSAPKVTAVDTTAAGDTFNGALAVALAEGKSLDEAIPFANCAAALSVTKLGAQSSIPNRKELDNFQSVLSTNKKRA